MFDWIASGTFQIIVLIGIVVAISGGIAVTAFRHKAPPVVPVAPPTPAEAPAADAEPPLRPQTTGALAVLEFDEDPRVISIARPRVMIGRHSDDDIRIKDVTVSRHHALLELGATGNFEIHNQTAGRDEPNQLLVNGVYKEHSVLSDGDLVTLGGVTFRFRRQNRQVA